MHGIIDTLLLNATAVSDFKKALPKNTPCNNLSTALRQQNKPNRYPPCCGVNRSQK